MSQVMDFVKSSNGLRLKLEEVSFRRGEKWILRNIDWEIHQGQHWAVLGANGSGKTTLVRVATGYEGSSWGRVFLIEGWISEIVLPEVRKKVGFVSSALVDHLLRWWGHTYGEEVVASGKQAVIGDYKRASQEDLARSRETLESLGFGYLAQARFGLMSSGERQICLFARSRMGDNDLLIFDEPCAGLDLCSREKVLSGLREACLAPEAPPTILITHHSEEILPEMTHVLLLRKGQVVACGPKQQVLNDELLSLTYGLPIHVYQTEGRYWAIPLGGKSAVIEPHE